MIHLLIPRWYTIIKHASAQRSSDWCTKKKYLHLILSIWIKISANFKHGCLVTRHLHCDMSKKISLLQNQCLKNQLIKDVLVIEFTLPSPYSQSETRTQRTLIVRWAGLSNPTDLWHLRHWLQFWQLRTWIHDNLCHLTIKSDTGQHSQFLRCL